MRLLAAFLACGLLAAPVRAGQWTTPGNRVHERGLWQVTGPQAWWPNQAAVATAPTTINVTNTGSGQNYAQQWLFSIGTLNGRQAGGGIAQTAIDLIGNTAIPANTSVFGVYPKITVHGPTSAFGLLAQIDVGTTLTNDGTGGSNTYNFSAGYYDHMAFMSPTGTITKLVGINIDTLTGGSTANVSLQSSQRISPSSPTDVLSWNALSGNVPGSPNFTMFHTQGSATFTGTNGSASIRDVRDDSVYTFTPASGFMIPNFMMVGANTVFTS